jgi:broad specificity phosphatase PhoE
MSHEISPKWPEQIWLIRHGQSAGNVARDHAEEAGLPLIDIATRDMDVPLSDLGERQADAFARWVGTLDASQRPTTILCSPYVRAVQTAERVLKQGRLGAAATRLVDERLREKEFGLLDRLTHLGIKQKHPELAEQRAHVGKFYFRPPGGESWCDVILRLRSVLDMLSREYRGERVLIVAHQVIVNCFRYLFEQLDEAQILAIDKQADVPNCAVTRYVLEPTEGTGRLVLAEANFVAPLEKAGTPVTTAKDVPAAAKP